MITYKDCPECGARKIHSTVRVCEVCETWAKAHAEGFHRGAEAMREACLGVVERFMDFGSPHPGMIAHKISALPIPDEGM